ncbi:hypothetical protein O998_04675 [Anaplasma phagocytophilum str. Norway variant1]|uniref:Outer membrane efflux family protein n=1 Tax=Anaplasma phagocytophilum str. Norway variant1 TaxID=1392506 RepID=A0A7H9E0R1_ANAPH|nr:TolC family protein [Anaplasma phagocytophilum]QLL67019.1 hypothetical protein O998_04675 [Anaplasma phagocytophilum str. Norway variant1]
MRKALLLFTLVLMKISSGAYGTSLEEALDKTLNNNLALKANMYKTKAKKREVVNSAIVNILPQVLYELKIQKHGSHQSSYSLISLTQPVFNGTAIFSIEKAKHLYAIQDITFSMEQQKTLLGTIKTYMSALSAYEVDKLNEHNLKVMQEHLLSAEKRFSVGEITKTELMQAKAKLAQAKSEAMSAKGRLRAVEASYTHMVGEQPIDLQYPKRPIQIPQSLEEAFDIAKSNNLYLRLSSNLYQVSKRDVEIAIAKKVLPSLHVTATETFPGNDVGRTIHRLEFTLRLPIFEHGVGLIDIDRTNQERQHNLFSMHEAVKKMEASIISAWEDLITSRFVLQSASETVKYTEVALEAITQEANLNLKTTLDVLDIEQELLKAKVNLVNSQSNLIINQYNLLALIGQLSID